jgi:hypothetical protein
MAKARSHGEKDWLQTPLTIIFMALPFLFGALTWLFQESDSASWLFLAWLLTCVICLVWGFFIRRGHLSLAWGCAAVGILHFALMFVLPMIVPHKTNWL